jgi:hypothetical protein
MRITHLLLCCTLLLLNSIKPIYAICHPDPFHLFFFWRWISRVNAWLRSLINYEWTKCLIYKWDNSYIGCFKVLGRDVTSLSCANGALTHCYYRHSPEFPNKWYKNFGSSWWRSGNEILILDQLQDVRTHISRKDLFYIFKKTTP